MDLDHLNRLPEEEAIAALTTCCASLEWARRLVALRPFDDPDSLREEAARIWWEVDQKDWLEAFAAHPRIGERREGADRHSRWSRREQSDTTGAGEDTLEELARLNREYEDRFGHVYLVFATGKTAEEMLTICRDRLGNEPADELQVAAAEQAKITDLRLSRLLEE